jgi:phosphatidylglycerophosphatase A
MSERPPASLLRNPLDLLALGFGSGLLPGAPGTAGTVVAIPVYLLLQPLAWPWYLAVTALLFGAGIPICAHTAARLGVSDHPGIVWDEIVGYLVTMTLAPAGWLWIAVGFVLFRLFDVLKPWPVRWCDRRVHGGLGIMLDDLVAGLFAAGILQLLTVYLPAA